MIQFKIVYLCSFNELDQRALGRSWAGLNFELTAIAVKNKSLFLNFKTKFQDFG